MGVWHEFCLVCGGPPYGETYRDLVWWADGLKNLDATEQDALRQLAKETRWTKYWVGVSSAEEQVRLGRYTEYGSFETRDGRGEFHLRTNFDNDNVPEGERYGIAAHRACATLLENELGYSLRFADLFDRLEGEFGNLLEEIDYGDIATYHMQNFELFEMWEDGLAWMVRNPLEDSRSRRRVLGMWRPFVRNIRAQEAKKKGKRPARAKAAGVLKARARRPKKHGSAR
ncbi:MAG: hypothetical protein HYW07_02845 [Candidatus Latescibacteria bacterium]|nr:hypothetical protein [Candidatus Latescibacterota bacterium]